MAFWNSLPAGSSSRLTRSASTARGGRLGVRTHSHRPVPHLVGYGGRPCLLWPRHSSFAVTLMDRSERRKQPRILGRFTLWHGSPGESKWLVPGRTRGQPVCRRCGVWSSGCGGFCANGWAAGSLMGMSDALAADRKATRPEVVAHAESLRDRAARRVSPLSGSATTGRSSSIATPPVTRPPTDCPPSPASWSAPMST